MSSTEEIKKRYNRVAACYDRFETATGGGKFEKWIRPLLNKAKGETLEIGVGTGKTIQHGLILPR